MKRKVGRILGVIYETELINERKNGKKVAYYHLFKKKGSLLHNENKLLAIFPHNIIFKNNSGFQN